MDPPRNIQAPKSVYPEPLVIGPTIPHTHSIILLHGLGSNAECFGVAFLRSRTSTGMTLTELFPGTKFIFPTATKGRATLFKRAWINQWFDISSFENPLLRPELQYEGLQTSSAFVYSLLQAEVNLVGAENVVLGGLSQGCAMGLHIFLSHPRMEPVSKGGLLQAGSSPLAGFVGMSGWLPFEEDIEDAAFGHDDEIGGKCLFATTDEKVEEKEEFLSPQQRACNVVRDIAELPLLKYDTGRREGDLQQNMWSYSPVFLGHGTADEKVNIRLGESASALLTKLQFRVSWKPYEHFGHWYKEPDEIDDIVTFLRDACRFKTREK